MKILNLPTVSLEKLKSWVRTVDRKILIQNSIALGGFLIFILLFFLPMLFHNRKMSREVNQLKEKVARANIRILKIPEMKKQKELFGTRAKEIREQFFEAEEADKLIEIISTLAGASGIRISASRPSDEALKLPEPFGNLYTPISYELVLEGSYHNLGMFVNRLEQYPKNFAIRNLQISAATVQDSDAHQCTLVVTAYMKHSPTA